MAKTKPTIDGMKFDSPDEVEMYHWCVEAVAAGVLTRYEYQWQTWELAPPSVVYDASGRKRKSVRKTTYTADFSLWFASHELSDRCGFWGDHVAIDVKPKFEPSRSRSQVFAINQKLVWHTHRVYVHPVVTVDLFRRTWLPKLAGLTSTGKPKMAKGYVGLNTIDKWVAQ